MGEIQIVCASKARCVVSQKPENLQNKKKSSHPTFDRCQNRQQRYRDEIKSALPGVKITRLTALSHKAGGGPWGISGTT